MISVRRFTSDPRRAADTLYLDRDPFAGVSGSIFDFIAARAGQRIIDFGCGTGGYAARLKALGRDVVAVDTNPAHVAATAKLGVEAHEVSGRLPFPDQSVDTLLMIEVLEHIDDADVEAVLTEVRRVVRRNLLMTVPDCADVDQLMAAGLTPDHFLATDHVQFFTRERLQALLERFFSRVEVLRGDPILPHLLLPAAVRRPISALYRAGMLKPTMYSRLFVEARVDG